MGLFPWVFVGSLIGSMFIVPMIPKIMDVLFYKDKYNNRASDVYQKYIDSCFTIKVVMPSYKSDKVLHNCDKERFPLGERFKVTYDSKKYFSNPSADYSQVQHRTAIPSAGVA